MEVNELIERTKCPDSVIGCKYLDVYDFSCRQCREQTMKDCVTAIETLLAEREAAGWISAEDRTPKDDDDGLEFICMTSATGRCNGVISLRWEVTKIRGKIVRRWMWHGRICPWEVTHWMPLPTPPDRQQAES